MGHAKYVGVKWQPWAGTGWGGPSPAANPLGPYPNPWLDMAQQDWSLEMVVRRIPGWSNQSQASNRWHVGNAEGPTASTGKGFGINHEPPEGTDGRIAGDFEGIAGPTVDAVLDAPPNGGLVVGKWTHVAFNFDRTNLMSGFRDNVAFDPTPTRDISARQNNLYDDIWMSPLYGSTPAEVYDDVSGGGDGSLTGLALPWVMVGHYAFHRRLLTGGEIATNAAALQVGQYSDTSARYGPWEVFNPLGASVPRPKLSRQHLSLSCKWLLEASSDQPYLDELTVYESDQADSDLTGNTLAYIRDLSGNGRHLPLYCRSAYDSSNVANRARFALTQTGPQGNVVTP